MGLLVGMRIMFHGEKPAFFLLGDSGISGFRVVPGQRIQDVLAYSNPDYRVMSWAETGAMPLDYFMQYSRGCLLAGKPQTVVIAMSPDKFIECKNPHRFFSDGVNLRWIPWNRAGKDFIHILTPRERNVALVQQASMPFYAVAELGKYLWERYVEWPSDRAKMLNPSRARNAEVSLKAAESGKARDTLRIPDDQGFANMPLARDGEFLLRTLREQGVETRVILLPIGNPDLIHATYSAHAQANLDTLKVRMRHWLEAQGQAYVDFNAPEDAAHFTGANWDDMNHLKSPAAFAYMAGRIAPLFSRPAARNPQSRISLINPDGDGSQDKRK